MFGWSLAKGWASAQGSAGIEQTFEKQTGKTVAAKRLTTRVTGACKGEQRSCANVPVAASIAQSPSCAVQVLDFLEYYMHTATWLSCALPHATSCQARTLVIQSLAALRTTSC